MDRLEFAILYGIMVVSLGMVALGFWGIFNSMPRGECVKREAWHLDGGSVIQAHGTKCVEWQ